jgi:hypothetical protein
MYAIPPLSGNRRRLLPPRAPAPHAGAQSASAIVCRTLLVLLIFPVTLLHFLLLHSHYVHGFDMLILNTNYATPF